MRLRDFVRGEFVRQVAVLSSGTALGQLIVAAVTPLLTRLYTPTDIGTFGLLASFIGVASVAANLRIDFAIASVGNPELANRLLVLCLVVCPAVSLLLAGVLGLLIGSATLSFDVLPFWAVPLTAVAVLATGIFTALRYWHVANQRFGEVGKALVSQGIGRAGSSVALGLAGLGWAGLALGDLVGRVLGIGRLWTEARQVVRSESWYGKDASVRLRETLRRVSRFPLVVLPSSLIDAFAAALPLPVIATLFGPAAAGQFALVWRVAAIPGALVASSVGDVFQAHASISHAQGDAQQLRRLLLATMGRLAAVAALVFMPLCVISPMAFPWVFGAEWATAGRMMLLLLPMWFAGMLVSPVSRLPMVVNRPGLKLMFDVAFLVAPIGALVIFAPMGLETATLAFGIAATAAYLGFGLVLLWLVRSDG